VVAERACGRVDGNARRPLEESIEGDPGLKPCQGSPDTEMDPPPEPEVLAGRIAIEAELSRCVEPARIAVGGGPDQHDMRPGWNLDSGQGCGANGAPVVASERRVDSTRFLDEGRDGRWISPEGVLEIRALRQNASTHTEEAGG